MAVESAALHRELGFWQLTASGIGIIVGAGIYALIGAATAKAGTGVWLSFLVAAGLSVLTGLSYCELAALYPRAGGEYEYTRNAFPQSVAFLTGWLMIAALAVGAAAVSLGFARYLNEFADIPLRPAALWVLVAAAAVAFGGIKQSGRLTVLLCLVQVGGLLLVIAIGLPHVGDVNLAPDSGADGILGGAALVFFAFIGFDEVITLAEETRDPSRTVPRALLAALGISASLDILVAITAVSVLGASALAASPRPLADALRVGVGGVSTKVVAFVALASTANAVLLMLTAASRLTYAMARSGALPARLGSVTHDRGVPLIAVVVCATVAAVFMLFGDLSGIASVTDFAIYLVFLAVNATVVILRIRKPELPRPFKIPFAVRGVPVIPILGFATTVVMLSYLELRAVLAGGAVVLAGYLFVLVFGRTRGLARAAEP
jgi:APA family basic amino acid/polyamine antiporter